MNIRKSICILLLLSVFTEYFYAQNLFFKYSKGDKYKILSTVDEDIFVNREIDHHSVIVNRISVEVKDVDENGKALHDVYFMTSEEATGNVSAKSFEWNEEYHSIFTRDSQGLYEADESYFMPVVRDVPYFPAKNLKPGDKWTHSGYEVHDFRQNFNIEKPYKIPFETSYEYKGTDKNGFHIIQAEYSIYYDNSVENKLSEKYKELPASTMGWSKQTIYWDSEKGAINSYSESFRIIVETNYGNVIEVRGTAKAEVKDFVSINTAENANQILDEVKKHKLENVTIKQDEKGITLSIENIKFKADSSELIEEEKIKLRKIAEILKEYPENDILVTGHTALAGTEKIRQQLSEQRARTVADYLIELGIKDSYHVYTRGMGASVPVASNANEAGKAKNRRVEITILDK